mmetsp:Transcript_25532/g.55490  ORF Transcript_25532/g.55490 Transcript_25532/m.55490 type:complete len:581 (-) Transcript_25532:808-2550(-)
MDGGPRGVLERVPNRVPRDGRLVRLGALPPEGARLDVLLGVVPGPPRVVQEERHEDAAHRGEHQERGHHRRPQQLLPRHPPHHPEHQPYGHRGADGQQPRLDHLAQGGGGHHGDAARVVGLLLVGHDAWALQELVAHLVHHRLRRPPHRAARVAAEQVHQHRPKQAADPHLRHRDVHAGEGLAGEGAHLVHVRAEQQERRQRRRSDGVPLGGGLGGVPDGVQQVGDLAHALGLLAHLHDAAGVVRDGPEDVHGEHVRRRAQHAHGGHRRAEQPANRLPRLVHQPGGLAEPVGGADGDGDDEHGGAGGLQPEAHAGDDVRAVPGGGGLRDAAHRPVLVVGVVLRDPHERVRRRDAHQPAPEKVDPASRGLGQLQHEVARGAETDDRERNGHGVALLHDGVGVLHRLLGARGGGAPHREDARGGHHQVQRVHHQREQDQAQRVVEAGLLDEAAAEDHGGDDLRRDGLEEVRAARRAVAHVVAHQVRDHRRVAGVVLGDPRLHLPDQVRAHVRRLGEDAPPQLREQRHEGGAEPVPHQQQRHVVDVKVALRADAEEHAEEGEEEGHAEHGHGHHHQPGESPRA